MSTVTTLTKEELIKKKTSTRYQTKRAIEIREREVHAMEQLKMLDLLFESMQEGEYSDEELDVLSKRRRSLQKKFKVKKKKNDSSELLIPFDIDYKTTIYIKESRCLEDEDISFLPREFIVARINEYKKRIKDKPEGLVYWNPF